MGLRRRAVAAATLPFLLGAGVFYAGKAEAQIELEISAEFYWEIGFKDENDEFVETDDELLFTFSGTADNGLRYGFDITLDDDTTRVTPDETEVFINGLPVSLSPGLGNPSFAFYNNVNGPFEDFADVQFGSVFGINPGTEAQLDSALQGGLDITLTGIDWVAFDNDGTTFAQGITINDALDWTAALDNTLAGQIALTYSGIGPLGPEGLLPSPAADESLLYEIRLDRVELVPLPATIWFFLGALGSLGVLRPIRARTS